MRGPNPLHWRDRIHPEPNSGCFLFEGSHVNGYGRVSIDGKRKMLHRVIWEETHGSIPPDLQVLHRCDMPACVNIDHLFLGTASDNMRDMAAKGRHAGGPPRALFCHLGHSYADAYVYNGRQYCKECVKIRTQRYKTRLRSD